MVFKFQFCHQILCCFKQILCHFLLYTMGKSATKHGVSKNTCSMRKSSQKSVNASTGETNQQPRGAAIVKSQTQTVTCSWSLSSAKAIKNSVSTRCSSVHKVAVLSEVSSNAGMGSMPVASRSPHSKARSNKKVTSYKSAGTVTHFPPQVTKQTRGGDFFFTNCIMYDLETSSFSRHGQASSQPLLGSSGPGDCGQSAPQEVLCRRVWIRSPTPSVSGDSDLDMDVTDNSAGNSLLEDVGSPPSSCVLQETSPMPAYHMVVDDSLVEMKASQNELEALDNE